MGTAKETHCVLNSASWAACRSLLLSSQALSLSLALLSRIPRGVPAESRFPVTWRLSQKPGCEDRVRSALDTDGGQMRFTIVALAAACASGFVATPAVRPRAQVVRKSDTAMMAAAEVCSSRCVRTDTSGVS